MKVNPKRKKPSMQRFANRFVVVCWVWCGIFLAGPVFSAEAKSPGDALKKATDAAKFADHIEDGIEAAGTVHHAKNAMEKVERIENGASVSNGVDEGEIVEKKTTGAVGATAGGKVVGEVIENQAQHAAQEVFSEVVENEVQDFALDKGRNAVRKKIRR